MDLVAFAVLIVAALTAAALVLLLIDPNPPGRASRVGGRWRGHDGRRGPPD